MSWWAYRMVCPTVTKLCGAFPRVAVAGWIEHVNPITESHPRAARRPRRMGAIMCLWRFRGTRELVACCRHDAYTGEIEVVAAGSCPLLAVARQILTREEAVE